MSATLETGYEKDDKALKLIGYLFKQSKYERSRSGRRFWRKLRRRLGGDAYLENIVYIAIVVVIGALSIGVIYYTSPFDYY